jgi:hypothetical protein
VSIRTPSADDGEQLDLHLQPLREMGVRPGGASDRFLRWAAAWVLERVRTHGSVWTDDLHLAAIEAGVEPPDASLSGRFWGCDARGLGLRRTTDERTSRAPDRNGAKARRWELAANVTLPAETSGA